ncbi:uncharacterized protein L3040_003339 [Drepanopeziza brunnea f. sp. 'multigermtubi']|uniref:uncharacterized protein n=1 Tax=Drepanopeziza brunnea f. sp. 'multigermtubi' TaxID=698441 RepID=UPI0023972D4B|nr:hypothetical protein L3040_003339 [Drepanopeziza brunnea f. sp. 'multigermtubi']
MSAAPAPGAAKATSSDKSKSADAAKDTTKPTAALEEDDEFEDFPVENWSQEEAEVPGSSSNTHLWEESWDDDDTSEDFSAQLKEELKKVEASKKR